VTDLATLISPAPDYASLAKILQAFFAKRYPVTETAIRDSLGLWHVSAGEPVRTQMRDFALPERKGRVAFMCNNRKDLTRDFSKYSPVIQLKLHTIDLSERLKRFGLLTRSEDKAYRRQLQTAKIKARREFERKLNLFGHYSHDLKTPFSTLISTLEGMVLSDEVIPAKLRLNLETVRRNIYSVLRSTGQSLDAARLLTRKKRATLIPYNFSAFVSEVAEFYAIIFESYGLKLRTEIAPDIPAVIDPIQMEKVLNNLLSNAIKHNIPGGLAHIALTHDRTQIHLTISDTGLGLVSGGEKVRDKNPWNLSSHGYGLEIVRELVRANRGKLKFKSEGGVGTTVSVLLPAAPELIPVIASLRQHNFQTTLREVEFLANERTRLSRRNRKTD
jgi:signal transduction histidine kinase